MFKLVTSNENKLNEFKRFGLNIVIEKGLDLKEVNGTDLEVIVHKAKDAGTGMIVEDTSLNIEGESVGVNVRWLLDNLHTYAGKKASWVVLIGLNDGESIRVFKGKINGVITNKETSMNGFGFDSLFIPEGSDKTLYELENEGLKDDFSARKLAIDKLVLGEYMHRIELSTLTPWEGPYQS